MTQQSFYNRWNEFLNTYNLYYRNLSVPAKQEFAKRLEDILNNYSIAGKENFIATENIKVTIAAYLVQLTFGLKKFWLYGYDVLYVYPDTFKTQHSAITYKSKIIELSFKHFATDYLNASDGRNIGMEQFAKALVQTVFNGETFDTHFASYLNEWHRIFREEFKRKNKEITAGDAFDLTDEFARFTALFFENPAKFKATLPETFAHFCFLLNQNTLNKTSDYVFSNKDFSDIKLFNPLPNKTFKHFFYKQWPAWYNLPLFGLIIAPILLQYLMEVSVINYLQFFISLLIIGLGFAALFKSYLLKLGLVRNIKLFAIYSITGVAPTLMLLFLGINYFTSVFGLNQSRHEVKNVLYPNNNGGLNKKVVLEFYDQYLADYKLLRSFEYYEVPAKLPQNNYTASYTTAKGILGIPVIKQKQLLVQP